MSQHLRFFYWSWWCTMLLLVSHVKGPYTDPDMDLDLDLSLPVGPLGDDSGQTRRSTRGEISRSHDGDLFGYPSATCKPCVCNKIKSPKGVIDLSSVVNCSDLNLKRIPTTLPNSTSSLNFSGNRLVDLDLDLDHLDLDHGEMWSVCERYRDLTSVSFAENGLTGLPNVLTGCQKSLEELTLTNNKLTVTSPSAFEQLQGLRSLRGLWVVNELPQSVFAPLTALSRLELTYTSAHLPGDLFQPLTSLRVLWLTLEGSQGLADHMTLPSGLTELRLHGSKLKHLPAVLLKNLANITTLHVDLPELRHLEWRPEDIATGSLEELSVKGVWEITSDFLAQLTSLVALTLQNVRALPDTAFFNRLGNLQTLEIINCSLASDSLEWITNLHTLTSLTLKQAQLAKLSPDALLNLSVLRNLDLSFNRLKEFPNVFLLPVRHTLEGLDLSMNLLTHLNATDFPSMPSLKGLDLSQNRLGSLDLDILMRTPRLSQLIVHGNALKEVSGDQIKDNDFIQLSLLDLSSNLLETIPAEVPLEKVATLDMSKNPLTLGFPVGRLKSLTTPMVVELHETPIACHCNLNTVVSLGILNGGVCSSPQTVYHQAMDQETMYKLCNRTEDDVSTTSKEFSLMTPVEPEEQDEIQNEEDEEEDFDDWSYERTLGPAKIEDDSIKTTLLSVTTVSATENERGSRITEVISNSSYVTTDQVTGQSVSLRPSESNSKMIVNGGVKYTTNQGKGSTQEDERLSEIPEQTHEYPTTTNYPIQMSSSRSKLGSMPTTDETYARNGTFVTPLIVSHGNYTDASLTEKNYGRINNTNNIKDYTSHIAKTRTPIAKCSNCSQKGLEKPDITNRVNEYNQGSTTPFLRLKGRFDVTEEDGVTVSNMSSHLSHKGSNNRSNVADQMTSSDHDFAHLPWIIAVCFLLLLLVLVYLVCRRKSRRGSHDLADDMGNENKAIAHNKMELMELGVAPPGGMPVIM